MPLASSGHKEFDQVLQDYVRMHKSKNHDYANDDEPLANFILQAEITGLSMDEVFFNMIAVKAARLKELITGKTPNNESMDDTIIDMGVYSALWAAWRKRAE